MLLKLYDRDGKVKAEISPEDSSTQEKEIQGDNLLNLSFTLYEYIAIDVNDYMDYGGERYWAVEKYVPAQKSTIEWEYSLQLYGIESLIKRFLILNNTDGANEAVFSLTARPLDHVRLIVKNINDGMAGLRDFKVGQIEGTDNVTIDYSGKYCNDGLKELAEAVGVEWWIEAETVNLCRCEHGEEVTLGYDKGLTSLDRDKADNAKFYTRLYPIGSSRNIDATKYGHSRLMLPNGVKYVDVDVERYGIIHHYEQKAFEDIYPRRVGVVSSVRSKEVKDKDGKPFTIYYFKDDNLNFDPNNYEIAGLVKHVSFQEGSELAGLGADTEHYFEVNFDSKTREFEIITIWPYNDDTQLPGGTLVPKVGDKYILWNIRMPDEYYKLAEKELRKAVDEYNRKHAQDVSRYKAPTDHVWIEETGTELFIGRRIRLESSEYFPGKGYRLSRITKISRKVNLPGQMELEISDALSTGTMAKMDSAIAEAKHYAGTLVGGINVPDVIRSWETTLPTDTNLYSARKSHKEFLSKNSPDRAKRKIGFDEGLELGNFQPGAQGGQIDETGSAELRSLRLRESLEVPELRYNRVSIYTGIRWDTFGGGIIESVTDNSCTLKLEKGEVGAIKEGDLCMGIWHDEAGDNATDTSDSRTGNFSFKGFKTVYFRIDEIPAKDAQGQDNSDFHYFRYQLRDGHNIKPFVGMHFAGRGNISDKERQSFVYTTTEYSLMLTGVKTWEWGADNIVSITGKLDGFSMKTASGEIKQFSGYGQVFGNAYMYGHIDQFDRAAERIEWATDNGEAIAEGEQTTVTLRAIKGFDEVQAMWSINNGSFAASASSFVVRYSDLDSNAVTTLFEVRAKLKSGATINTTIPIKRLENGKSSYTHIKYSEDGKTFSGERPYILTPLPKGYTPCKYLLSNGGYIDTGVMADAPVKMWGVFAGPSAGDYSILAARKDNTRLYLAHVYGGKYQYGYGNLLPIRYNDGGDTAIITRLRADEQFAQCDTTIVQAADTANISLNLSLYLFACNYNGTAAFIAPAETRLTSCKIYSAGFAAQGEIFISMARDFVPCLNSDGVAGLYDLVEGKFYTSANDKAFTAVPIDKGDKELIYDSYELNLLDNVESKTNRSYSVATFNIPAHLRGHKLSFSAKVTGELVDGVDVVKKYGVFADAYTTKRNGSFVWPNSLKLCIPDADGYVHYDNLDTGETSVVLYVYTYHHVRIKTNDADNPLVTLSEPMLTITPTAKPFEPPLKDMRRGTLSAAYMGVNVSESKSPSNNFDDYTWKKIEGAQGAQGEKGEKGADGRDGAAGASLGRNLLRNADFHTSEDIRDVSGALVFRLTGGSITGETFNGSGVLKDKCNFYVHNLPSGAYTLSFWSKNAPNDILIDTNDRVYVEVFRCTANNSSGRWSSSYIAAIYDKKYYSEWTKHTLTFNFKREIVMDNGNTYDYDSIRVLFYASGHTIYTSQPKLEIGDTASDFCLNEEDQKGQNGTSITPKGQLTSSANLPTTAQKGDSYIIDGYLWVYTGSNTTGAVRGFINAGSIKGPAGASSYVHIAYANSADGTVNFTTKDNAGGGKTYLFVGICVDTNPADPTDVNRYKWTALAAEPVRPNILYQAGFEEGRIDYWQAGQALANTKIDINACNGRNALTLTGNDGALVAQNIGDRLQPNRWYTMSFYAKVKAGIHVLATGGFIESNAAGGHFAPLPDSTDLDLLSLSPNSDYKFYSVTFKTRPTLPAGDKFLSFTLWGAGSSICMPKLEEGQTATAFMVNENDLKASTLRPCGQWSNNVTYENNRLYIDVVSHNGQYYSCKKTNVGQEPAANSQFWKVANKMKFVATDLLLAESAFIENLGVRRIATRASGPRFMAEAAMWALYGTNEKPSIESWVDDEGNAHLRVNNKDGEAVFDLGGAEGSRNFVSSPAFDAIGLTAAMPLEATDEQVRSKLLEYAAGGLDKVTYERFYQYHSGKNALTKPYDNKVFVSDTLALSPDRYCPNGRYILKGTVQESEPQFVRDGLTYPSALVAGSATVWTINNGTIIETKGIIWVRTVYK